MTIRSSGITTMTFEVTKRCPLNCFYCYNLIENDLESNELSTVQWTRLIEKLPELETGIITGGEPLLRKDIFTITRKLRANTENLIILTSGQVMTDEIASGISDTGVALQVQSSQLGARYDVYPGRGGSFYKIERSFIILNKYYIPFTSSFLLSMSNRKSLENILSFHLAAGSSHLLAIRYIPQVGQSDLGRKLLGIEDYRDLLKRLNRFSKKNKIPISLGIPNLPCVAPKKDYKEINMPSCGAGNHYFTIDQLGRLKICPHHISSGLSLLNVSLEEAVAGIADAIFINKKLPVRCEECVFTKNCGGGCRSGAISLAGEGSPDPLFWELEK
ncbi:MAG: radical SAM protein [Candidatus Thermoplasmatota archaeon]|nr:radical SAM protein [Candidatus Thermoplasmatota archaeon]